MCYPADEFLVGDNDVKLGEIGGVPVYISGSQFEAWRHTQLIIDVVPGRGGMFSLDNGREKRFLTRSRLFNGGEACAVPWLPLGCNFLGGAGILPDLSHKARAYQYRMNRGRDVEPYAEVQFEELPRSRRALAQRIRLAVVLEPPANPRGSIRPRASLP